MLATIGYERADLRDFLATLELCEIDILVDVRDRAQSRRPGFSKSALSAALSEAGIEYLHLPQLGDPKEGRDAARRGDYAQFRAIFHDVMTSESGKVALSSLENIASTQNVCLMCFERNQLECHRKIVADYLEIALKKKAQHLGVRAGAWSAAKSRRVRHLNQGAASPIQPVL